MTSGGCLDSPTSGRYLLGGVDVSAMDDADLAKVRNKKIGFVFQSFNLLSRYDALENVAFPLIYSGIKKAERIRRAQIALESVGLSQRIAHLPGEMSGGQRQRVAIARALVTEPDIILADEPTGNLDTKNTQAIVEILKELAHKEGYCVVVVTHDEKIGFEADRLLRLRDGEIVQ